MRLLILLCLINSINGFINFNSIFRSSLNIINKPNIINYKPISSHTTNNNITFVIWTGYKINPIHYSTFVSNIQTLGIQHNLNIEAIVSNECYLPENKDNIYLFGHSSGGYRVLLNNCNKIKSKIVYGATHNFKNKLYFGFGKILPNNDINTLTILGEYDKYINIFNIKDEPNNPNQYNIIAKGSNHLTITNGKTNCLMALFEKENIKNDSPLNIANICMEFILMNENKNNNLNYYVSITNTIINVTSKIHLTDKNIFVNYLLTELYKDYKQQNHYNLLSFLWSKPFFNNIHTYVDLEQIWIKTSKSKIDKYNLNDIYKKIPIGNEIKIITHYNIISWILSKCYVKNNVVHLHHFGFMFFNYYKLPTMYFFSNEYNF